MRKDRHNTSTQILGALPLEPDGSVVVPEGVERIGPDAFKDQIDLRRVILPSSLRVVDECAFRDCSRLTELVLPEGLVEIGCQAFCRCLRLASVHFPSTLRTIGDMAFADCARLRDVHLPAEVESIGARAFASCWGIEKFSFSTVPAHLGSDVLEGCPRNLKLVPPPGAREEIWRARLGIVDDDGFLVQEGCLVRYLGHSNPIRVPDGVTEIREGVLDHAIKNHGGHDKTMTIELPSSLCSWKLFEWTNTSLLHLRFPPELLENKLSAHLINLILECSEPGTLPALFCAKIFFTRGRQAAALAERHLLTPDAVPTLLEYCEKSRSKAVRSKMADFFFRHEELFSVEDTARLSQYIQASRSDFAGSEADSSLPIPYPEPLMDEILISYEVDPNDAHFSSVPFAGSQEYAPAALVKGAVVPYLRAAVKFDTDFRKAQKVSRNTRRLPADFQLEAEACARHLDRSALARLVHDLFLPGRSYELQYGYFLPYARYASEQSIQKTIEAWRPLKSGSSSLPSFHRALADALVLSDTKSAFEWAVANSEDGKYFSPLAEYIRVRSGNPPIHPVHPSCLSCDEQGRFILSQSGCALRVETGAQLTPGIRDVQTGKVWKRMPRSLPLSSEEYARTKEEFEVICTYLKELWSQLSQMLLEWYWHGDRLRARDFLEMFDDPILSKAFTGVVWSQDGTDFAYVQGSFQDPEGNQVTPDSVCSVQMAHVLDLGEERMKQWQAALAKAGTKPWMCQVVEPAYDVSKIDEDRYRHMSLRTLDARAPGASHFLYRALMRLREGYSSISGASGATFAQGYHRSEFRMEKIRIYRSTREHNLTLYLLDQLTADAQVRCGNLAVLPALRSVSDVKLRRLMNIAHEAHQVEFAAQLLQIQKDRSKGTRRTSKDFHL